MEKEGTIEVYSTIEEMKNQSDHQKLSYEDAFKKTLNILDMYASLKGSVEHYPDISWIELSNGK